MNGGPNYTLVGLFVVVITSAFVMALVWLTVAAPYQNYSTYLVYMSESVAGLTENAQVKYQGVDVGRVSEISVDPDQPARVRLVLQVMPETPVRTNTVAKLEMQGLTGLGYINLVIAGPEPGPPLPSEPGKPYPVIESVPSLYTQLDERLNRLLVNVTDISESLNAVLGVENREAFGRTLTQMQALTERLTEAAGHLQVTLQNTRQATGEVPQLVERAQTSMAAFETMAEELTQAGSALGETVTASGGDVTRFTEETLPEARAMVLELREAAENLRLASEAIRRDPSVLLYGERRRPGPGE